MTPNCSQCDTQKNLKAVPLGSREEKKGKRRKEIEWKERVNKKLSYC